MLVGVNMEEGKEGGWGVDSGEIMPMMSDLDCWEKLMGRQTI